MNPVFSIIIPCYNHGRYLQGAIDSVETAGIPYEIIIVNDGSEAEETLAILADFERKGLKIIHQKNAGPGAARNNGIKAARGKYIVPLDADDRLTSEYIPAANNILENNEHIHVVYADYQQHGEVTGRYHFEQFSLQELLLYNNIGACAIFRKAVWETVGGYDETLRKGLSWEDWDFWLNIAYHGYKFKHIDIIGYNYLHAANSRERQFLSDKTKVNSIISYFEEKYKGFYNPRAIHTSLLNQIKKNRTGMLMKILLASFFPKYYNKAVAQGKIRKYII